MRAENTQKINLHKRFGIVCHVGTSDIFANCLGRKVDKRHTLFSEMQ